MDIRCIARLDGVTGASPEALYHLRDAVSAACAARSISSAHSRSKEIMRLAAFITTNTPSIIVEWENFAQTLVPAAQHMSPLALRNHIRGLLKFIAEDMQTDQTDAEQKTKSRGESPILLKYSAAKFMHPSALPVASPWIRWLLNIEPYALASFICGKSS